MLCQRRNCYKNRNIALCGYVMQANIIDFSFSKPAIYLRDRITTKHVTIQTIKALLQDDVGDSAMADLPRNPRQVQVMAGPAVY